jgi:hypothetical protein
MTTDTDSSDTVLGNVELQVFKESIQGLSKKTIQTYTQMYNKLRAALDKEIQSSSQELIIKTAKQMSGNLNTQAAIINIGLLVRRLYALDVKELDKQRKVNKKGIADYTAEQNAEVGKTLPTLADFDAHIDILFKQNRFQEYIINWLIRHLQTRNQDLLFELATKKADVKSNGQNYMYLGRGKAIYYRRDYKTVATYGEKVNEITDKKFLTALKKANFPLIAKPLQVGYFVKRMSYNQLGEGALLKVIVNDVREKGDFHALTAISKNRGTDVCLLTTAYNVQATS